MRTIGGGVLVCLRAVCEHTCTCLCVFTCVYMMFMCVCLHASAYGSVCIDVRVPMLGRLCLCGM